MNLLKIHWRILAYVFLIPWSLLVSIMLTIINLVSAISFDRVIGPINAGIFCAAHTFHCSGVSESSLLLSSSISDSFSASQSCSLSFGLSKSPIQLSQFWVAEMLSGEQASSLLAGWQSIRLIGRTSNTWVLPPWRSFAHRAGGTGDFSDNENAAAPSCWQCDQDALTISSVSEMYPLDVICVLWARHSFCVARRFWLPCHISKKSWTLATRCYFFCSASLFISMSLSVLVGSNPGSSPASNQLFAQTNCLTTTFSQRVSRVVFDCLQPITSRPRDKVASTPTPWGMIENISRATLARLEYYECVSSCCRHQSVISSNQDVLQISLGSEW